MADMLRITYYAEGHRNGCKVTLSNVCGRTYDDCIVASSRWYGCNSARKSLSFSTLLEGTIRKLNGSRLIL